jgi:hypothetical protein
MRAHGLIGFLLALASVCPVVALGAGDAVGGAAQRSPLRPATLGAWVGLSYNSPDDQFLGVAAGRDFHEFALRIGWRLLDYRLFRAEYTVDLIPFAMVTNNPTYTFGGPFVGRPPPKRTTEYETKYGVGAAPIGLRMGIPVFTSLFLFASGSAGFIAFEGAVPTFGASSFNYTFDFGGGLEGSVTDRWLIYGGYKLHHLSNAGSAYENPGIDSNMFYVGSSWLY